MTGSQRQVPLSYPAGTFGTSVGRWRRPFGKMPRHSGATHRNLPQTRGLTCNDHTTPAASGDAWAGRRNTVVQTGRMRTELATVPGDQNRPNEDYASVALPVSGRGGALVVLDGVTPPQDGDGCLHSVPWFTARLGGALGELSVSRPDLDLPDVLGQAIARTADAHRTTCDLSHPRTPQATVALVRWDDERIEHLVLADSVLLVVHADGRVEPVLDDRIARLPRAALRSAAVTDATVRNKEGGFFTAAADPDVAVRAVTGTRPRTGVRALAALTDGAARWVERFGAGGWDDCVGVLRKEGPRGLIDRVRELEDEDAAAEVPRRGKVHDDAAVVYVEF